jgi:Ser/Thr protein kinase RdoA (MazF antagonist)
MSNYFPVTRSVLSAKDLLLDVISKYDIETPLECSFLHAGLNDSYLINAKTGKYILRVYRAGWRSDSDILSELDVLLHLKRRGVPVSAPVPRKDGTLLYKIPAPEGDRTIVLFTYAPGKPMAYADKNECLQYGKSVARIHSETDEFKIRHQRFSLNLEHLLDEPLKNVKKLLMYRPDDWNYLQSLAERLRQHIMDVPLSVLEKGFCHGDFHGGNAHIEQDGTITFFDFDCCGYGWRAYDIAVFRWSARLIGREKEQWPHFLSGYQEMRLLSEADIKSTRYFVAIRHLWLLGLHTGGGRDWGSGWMNDQYFDKAIKFFREWEEELHSETDEKHK